MNFLELCQDLVREAGITGTIASVNNQSGELLRVTNWVRKAYRNIVNMHPQWKFLRTDVVFATLLGNADYTASTLGLTEFGEWKLDSFRAYLTAAGVVDEQPMPGAGDYDAFRNRYMLGAMRTQSGRPLIVAEKPDQTLHLFPLPDAAYTIVGEYFKFPLPWSANTDLPLFPAKFHEVITWRALMYYAEYEGDATAFAAGQAECKRILAQMELLYLPQMVASETMA